MSTNSSASIKTAIIGGGCAGYSLARKAAAFDGVTVLLAGKEKRQDHSWGFFINEDTAEAGTIARKTWHRWQVITSSKVITQVAKSYPYAGLESKAWLSKCKAEADGVKVSTAQVEAVTGHEITTDQGVIRAETIFDSRPPHVPEGMMIQSFFGHEVQTAKPVFDPDCAILMDFRCDQSRGIHFIYVLPYSERQALIESTMFAPKVEDDAFYEKAISDYLATNCGVEQVITLRREKGAIPMGILDTPDDGTIPIGGRGGAIRPSSGYAFAFIQRQVGQILAGEPPYPHQKIDLMMDRIFLKVLKSSPKLAPKLFSKMATRLNGDEMARFMSGRADMALRMKVILAMPKWPFVMALIKGGW